MKIITFFILLFFSSTVFANNLQKAIIYTKSGDTLNVKVDVYKQGILLTGNKIKYFQNGKKSKIAISKINFLDLGIKRYDVIEYSKERKTGPNRGIQTYTILAELIDDGKVKLYRSNVLKSTGHMMNGMYMSTGTVLVENFYMVTGKGTNWVSGFDFKRNIKTFFPGCELIGKVKDKVFRFRDIIEAVAYGNKHCF